MSIYRIQADEARKKLAALQAELQVAKESEQSVSKQLALIKQRIDALQGRWSRTGEIAGAVADVESAETCELDDERAEVIWKERPGEYGSHGKSRETTWVVDKVTKKLMFIRMKGATRFEQFVLATGRSRSNWTTGTVDVEATLKAVADRKSVHA